jgi:MHS family shikimate/dehydroshikimate transporter-like MFS transporter
VGAASFVGALIEWYDFFLYGLAAALVFDELFFPSENPTLSRLAAFATFGVGFFARPVGGALFGNCGDKVGRKSMLVLTLLIMGVGISIGYQLAAVFAGGLAPFIATALFAAADSYWPVALQIVVAGLVSLVSVVLATETFRAEIADAA